ncbi:hypothetical protein ONZ45_g12032 [Pleurotus djamor]|nr:hypothetical protein ONZ45_g12032 [Pleurotus djamor]
MSLSELTVLLDSTDPSIVYGSGWTQRARNHHSYMGGSVMEGSGDLDINLSFYGTGIQVWGVSNATFYPVTTIDNATVQGGYLDLPNYRPWYTSPALIDHQHDLSLQLPNATYAMLDYIVVSAGPSTPVNGKIIIADDFDSDIDYDGSWDKDFGQVFPSRDSNSTGRLSFRNTTHSTRHRGDSFTFEFTGTSVSVFGILQSHLSGRVAAKFSVDGSSGSTYIAEFNNSSMRSYDQTHTQFYNTSLAEGTHTLDVEVMEVSGDQSFMLDYITYNASFENLLVKPERKKPTETLTKIPPGVTAGVIAAAVILALLLIAFCWRRRRRPGKEEPEHGSIDLNTHHAAFDPETPEMSHRGTFYRKSFGMSSQTLVAGPEVDPDPPSLPRLPSFAFPSVRPDDADIHRIDPFILSSSRPSSPHRRKKSEMLASIDTSDHHYYGSPNPSGFHLPSPSTYHASQSSSDVSAIPITPSSPYRPTHTSSRSTSSRRSKSVAFEYDSSPESLPRPPSSHHPSYNSKHARTPTSTTNISTYPSTPSSAPPSAIPSRHGHSRHSSHLSISYPNGIPQVELRRRTQEIYEMVARLEDDIALAAAAGPGSEERDSHVFDLRQRVAALTRENARLHNRNTMIAPLPPISTGVEEPPPAYHTPGPATC